MIKIFKNLNLLEKKDHIIRKIPNLTNEQKEELINFFDKHPNYENRIDWNRWRTLTYEDFKGILEIESKTQKKKSVKISGIKGLKEGEDYIQLKGLPDDTQGYIPLNYEASKFIASRYVGGIEGRWCTAYQKTREYWEKYTSENIILIYLINNNTKYAIAVYPNNKTHKIYDSDDNKISYIPGIDINRDILNKRNISIFEKIRREVEDYKHWIHKAEISRDARFEIDKTNQVIWYKGTWVDGVWERGTWINGIWFDGYWAKGAWKNGIWRGGTWEKGTWEDGTWEKGIWYGGTWKDGIWEHGTWKDGTWKYGTWKNGVWESGTWKDGVWKSGTWKNGAWESGTWKDGTWKLGIWELGTWINGTWESGTWEYGTWKDGVWEGGDWDDGNWEKGVWKGGRIWNPETGKYQYSDKNPNECEWSLSYYKR